MAKVTRESLSKRISRLECDAITEGISLNEEYQLEAYKMLLDVMSHEVVGYTSQRAIEYEIWNSGSTVIKHKPEYGDVPMMVAPDFIIEDKQ